MANASDLVVIPTYNESASIRDVITVLLESAPFCNVLVVDDDSPDGTANAVEALANNDSRIHLLKHGPKRGLGRAYVSGFGWGLERGYNKFVEMDADLSHDPRDVPRLLERADSCDLVIGSRYVDGGEVRGWTKGRHLLSRAGNQYARGVLGFDIQDSTAGFRCYRRKLLLAIDLAGVSSDGYAFQIDMAYRTWRLGFEICEIPITFLERHAGRSKMSRAIVAEAIASVTGWGLRDLFLGRRRETAATRRAGSGEKV